MSWRCRLLFPSKMYFTICLQLSTNFAISFFAPMLCSWSALESRTTGSDWLGSSLEDSDWSMAWWELSWSEEMSGVSQSELIVVDSCFDWSSTRGILLLSSLTTGVGGKNRLNLNCPVYFTPRRESTEVSELYPYLLFSFSTCCLLFFAANRFFSSASNCFLFFSASTRSLSANFLFFSSANCFFFFFFSFSTSCFLCSSANCFLLSASTRCLLSASTRSFSSLSICFLMSFIWKKEKMLFHFRVLIYAGCFL